LTDFILSVPDWAGALVAVLFSTAVGLGVYWLSSRLVERYQGADLKQAAQSLLFALGIFIALMLSLAFGEAVSEWRDVQNAIKDEAIAISDTFEALERFDQNTDPARIAVLDYVQAVIDDDWPALADDSLGDQAGELRKRLVVEALALEPASPGEEEVMSRLLDDLDSMSDARQSRLAAALAQPPLYTYVVFVAFIINMAFFGVYRPQPLLLGFVSLFTGLVGLVLYLILDLSDPFQGIISVDPKPLVNLLEVMRTSAGQ